MKGLVWVAAGSPEQAGAAESATRTAGPGADREAWSWLAAYLGSFPRNAVVPRLKLRNIADARWPDAESRPPPSQARGSA